MKLLYANDHRGEHAPSWYRTNCPIPGRAPLEHHISADVCVIGAGFTGLAAALELSGRGYDTVVLDAHRVGWGASGRNGGQLGSGFNMDQLTLEGVMGKPAAHALWQIAQAAKTHIHQLCEAHSIDMDYRPGIIHAQHRRRGVQAMHDYCDHLSRHYGYDAMEPLGLTDVRRRIDSQNYFGGVIDHGAGHIHPLKLASGVAQAAEQAGTRIHELSEVLRIAPCSRSMAQRVITAGGSVLCGKVILAVNGYLDNLHPSLNRWVMPINNFIIVTEHLGERAASLLPQDDAVADSRFVVNYFRRVDTDRLLFGGGENYSYRFPVSIERNVRRAMLGIFPQLQDVAIDYAWGGTLAITRNRLPSIRRLSPELYSSGGYSGHGLALAFMYGTA
ncbi:MAG: FAD-binding oxidoreductase, partial [Granulosicoccus sp.]|nr:FAD-binding oxidoreductase [Granulosicoccus sp.]